MPGKLQPEFLVKQVTAHPKYQQIAEDLIFHLSREAIAKGLRGKPAVKYVRNKLHQVGGAYFKQPVDYATAIDTVKNLPQDLQTLPVRDFCQTMMKMHTSSAERLPILEAFYQTCLAPIAPITSILDLACGLNPLAIPWMPLVKDFKYFACDIYLNMLGMLNAFFSHFSLEAIAKPCNLVTASPSEKTQVALLLKSIPCLEQLDKSIPIRLLENIQSEHILISFPAFSLRGRSKGMPTFYGDHFKKLIVGKSWEVHIFYFDTELAFLVSK